MALKLLGVGDVHLGRRPTRLPRSLAERASELGPAEAWTRTVKEAVDSQVDAVLLAGDVVEREDDFFEAYRRLSEGVGRLAEAGIRVLGVAGNHDVEVLPRLAGEIPAFRLLGAGGRWEAEKVEAGGESVTVWGWSFPRSRVSESPLGGLRFEPGPTPDIGLLHCDRDQSGSGYAPVTSGELEEAGLDAWLLGHIHRPDALSAARPFGYLGSLTASDPGERGGRGPWLFRVEGGRIRQVEQWTLAPLRWERIKVDLGEATGPEQARDLLLRALKDLDARIVATGRPPEVLGLRVVFVGHSRFGRAAAALFSEEERTHPYSGEGGTHYFIERIVSETLPEIRLERLALRTDPPGLLARRLLLLDRPAEDPERRALLTSAVRVLEEEDRDGRWSGLRRTPPDEAAAVRFLRGAGLRLLHSMMAQQEPGE